MSLDTYGRSSDQNGLLRVFGTNAIPQCIACVLYVTSIEGSGDNPKRARVNDTFASNDVQRLAARA